MDQTTKKFLEKLSQKDLYFTLSKNNLLRTSPKEKQNTIKF
ncbi:hypothetical protein Q9Q37_08310 [Campylobacter upsaliensis]|nr:hypothetical protein [Campylobacter upsaliensis]MEB2828883.1 hypothetical protein [Campylobacter upsaliensis]